MPNPAASTPRPCVVITTYARPDSLALLLDDIERDQPAEGIDVRVYDDATPIPTRLSSSASARAAGPTGAPPSTTASAAGGGGGTRSSTTCARARPRCTTSCRTTCGCASASSSAAPSSGRRSTIRRKRRSTSTSRPSAPSSASSCWTPVRATRAGQGRALRLGRLRGLHVRPAALRGPGLAAGSDRRPALARQGRAQLGCRATDQRPRAEARAGPVPRRQVADRARRRPIADERRGTAAVVDGDGRLHRRPRGGACLRTSTPTRVRLAGDDPRARASAAACRRGVAAAGRHARRLPQRVRPRPGVPRP